MVELSSVYHLLWSYSLTEENCNRVVNDAHIEEISRCYSREWKSLPPHLGVESIVADDISRGSGDLPQKRHAFFNKWKRIKGSDATYFQLISALMKIKCKQDAEEVCKLLQDSLELEKDRPDHDVPQHCNKTVPVSQLSPDVIGDLRQVLETNLKKITRQYASYVSCILQSVKAKEVSPETLSSFLLNLSAFSSPKDDNQKLTLLSGLRAELENATTINKIFNLLSSEYASFLDYEIFEFIIEEYEIDESRPKMKYPEYLKAFINMHKLVEFMEINPLLKDFKDCSKELILKIDIDTTCTLARLKDLTKSFASILGLKKSALRLLDITEGCVMIRLLVLAPIADYILANMKYFISQRRETFTSFSIMWLKCNNATYYFATEEKFKNDSEVGNETKIEMPSVEEFLKSLHCSENLTRRDLSPQPDHDMPRPNQRSSIRRSAHVKTKPSLYLRNLHHGLEVISAQVSPADSIESLEEESELESISRHSSLKRNTRRRHPPMRAGSLKLPLQQSRSGSPKSLFASPADTPDGGHRRLSPYVQEAHYQNISRSSSFSSEYHERWSRVSDFSSGYGTDSPRSMSSYSSTERIHEHILEGLSSRSSIDYDGMESWILNSAPSIRENLLDRDTMLIQLSDKMEKAKVDMERQLQEYLYEETLDHFNLWLKKYAEDLLRKSKELDALSYQTLCNIPAQLSESRLTKPMRKLMMITAKPTRLLQIMDGIKESGASSQDDQIAIPSFMTYLASKLPDTYPSNSNETKENREVEEVVPLSLPSELLSEEQIEKVKWLSNGVYSAVYKVRLQDAREYFGLKKVCKYRVKMKNLLQEPHPIDYSINASDDPFVARVYSTFQTESHFFSLKEHIEGADLATLLKNTGGVPLETARKYLSEMVLTVDYLHEFGITHRGLCPDNILITPEGHIKLADFGLSKLGLISSLEVDDRVSQDQHLMKSSQGQLCYIAPEVVLGQEHDRMVDWWSVGVILYEMFAGTVPFSSPHDYFTAITKGDSIDLWPTRDKSTPPNLADLASKLICTEPLSRLGSPLSGGVEGIKKHAFFNDLDWENVLRQKAEFVTSLCGDGSSIVYVDTHYSYGDNDLKSPSNNIDRRRRDSGIDESDVLSILSAKAQQLAVSDLISPASLIGKDSVTDLENVGHTEGIMKDMEYLLDGSVNPDLDITLSPPTPGPVYMDEAASNDITLIQSSPSSSQNMVASSVTVQKSSGGFGLTIRSVRVYFGDSNDYKICHVIEGVDHDSLAWKSGLRPNQLITHINGTCVTGLQHVETLYLMSGKDWVSMNTVPLKDSGICKSNRNQMTLASKGHRIGRTIRHHSSIFEKKRPSYLTQFLESEKGRRKGGGPIRHHSPHRSESFNEKVCKKLEKLEHYRKSSHLTAGNAFAKQRSPSPSSPISPIHRQSHELKVADHPLMTRRKSIGDARLFALDSPILKHPEHTTGPNSPPLLEYLKLNKSPSLQRHSKNTSGPSSFSPLLKQSQLTSESQSFPPTLQQSGVTSESRSPPMLKQSESTSEPDTMAPTLQRKSGVVNLGLSV